MLPLTGHLEDIPCALCGGERFEPISRRDRYGLPLHTVCCVRCSLIFTNPRPDSAWFEAFYRDDYRRFYESVETPTREYAEHPSRVSRHTTSLNLIAPALAPRGRCLDIGSAEGGFLRLFRDRFGEWDLCGIEPNREFTLFAQQTYGLEDLHVGQFPNDLPGQPDFDLIHCSHVLEHIPDPVRFLAECRQRLAPGGLLFIQVPNALNARRSFHVLHVAHLFHYSTATLSALLGTCGFDVVWIRDAVVVPRASKRPSIPLDLFALCRKAEPVGSHPPWPTPDIPALVRRLRSQWRIPLHRRIRMELRALLPGERNR